MKTITRILVAMSSAVVSSLAFAQNVPSSVTVDNYNRAQTDFYFAGVGKSGGFGRFRHGRELAPPVKQGIVRPNRDTLYSFAIFDFDAGPVTITLPEGAKRYMGMQVVNQDQYTRATYYEAGNYTLNRSTVGTRYGIVVVRFLVDFSNKEEIQKVHTLQDAIKSGQERSGGTEKLHFLHYYLRITKFDNYLRSDSSLRLLSSQLDLYP